MAEPFHTVITARDRDLGGFSVRRLLPAIGRKMVGPFTFFDHMGPADFAPGQGMDVRPHPHIGLATVTYLFDGAIGHLDSLGSNQVIRPGDVNWMTAGRGIVHSERTPPDIRRAGGRVDGIQCWLALPRAAEEVEPSFVHHPGATLPELAIGGATLRLLLGDAFGKTSPAKLHCDTLYIDAKMPPSARVEFPAGSRELGVYVASGAVKINGTVAAPLSLTIGYVGQALTVEATTTSRVMVIGGQPFGEAREIWWNFVSSSKERIEKAKGDWREKRFGPVPGDESEFIPLPEQ